MLGIGRSADVSEKPPLATRLRAWWEGEELAPAAAAPPHGEAPPQEKPPLVLKGWSGDRIGLVQQIFGEGMTGPFDEEIVRQMIDPLCLDEKMTVVELGAGLGGLARFVARHTGAYVTALEPDATLAARGAELSTRLGMAKKAAVVHAPKDAYEVRQRTVDAVVSKEALFNVENKKQLLHLVRKSMKPGAQIIFTDFMLEGDPTGPEILVWQAHEPVPPHLMRPEEYRAELEKLAFEVRVFDDITGDYLAALTRAFGGFAESLRQASPEDERRRLGLLEAEHWNRRARLLGSGQVRVHRVYARLSGAKT
ncbi:MAG: methyltransferase domain-containing protein [Alphaproteobacteria bacterium]|nr:methyltransferase domain-containing protein [Alphaproteobacteria bacterium]